MERFFAGLERRFGRYAPSNVTLWWVALSGVVTALLALRPATALMLDFDRGAILRGEVWRLFTCLLFPWGGVGGGFTGPLFALIALMFLYQVGTSIEAIWGSLRYDLFLLLSALGVLAAGFLLGGTSNHFLYHAVLLTYAALLPEQQILAFMIVPVKLKIVGLLDLAYVLYLCVTGGIPVTLLAVFSFIGFFLFSLGSFQALLPGRGGVARLRPRQSPLSAPAQAFAPQDRLHRTCARCGRSEADDPHLEFRVCDCAERCQGKLTTYCIDHARDH